MRRVQALAAQQRPDFTRLLARVRFPHDPQLVLRRVPPARGALDQLRVRHRSGAVRSDLRHVSLRLPFSAKLSTRFPEKITTVENVSNYIDREGTGHSWVRELR